MRMISVFTIAVSLAAATAALAQSPAAPTTGGPAPVAATAEDAGRAKFRAACGADIQKLCAAAVTADAQTATPEMKKEQRGKVRACLTENKAQVSSGCMAYLAEREAAQAAKKN